MMSRQEQIERDFVERQLTESIQKNTLLASVFFVREADGSLGKATLSNDVTVNKREIVAMAKYLLAKADELACGVEDRS